MESNIAEWTENVDKQGELWLAHLRDSVYGYYRLFSDFSKVEVEFVTGALLFGSGSSDIVSGQGSRGKQSERQHQDVGFSRLEAFTMECLVRIRATSSDFTSSVLTLHPSHYDLDLQCQ